MGLSLTIRLPNEQPIEVPGAVVRWYHIIQFWDDILHFIATIKLKETTASDIFRRLNSYSKQHDLYQALKAFWQPFAC